VGHQSSGWNKRACHLCRVLQKSRAKVNYNFNNITCERCILSLNDIGDRFIICECYASVHVCLPLSVCLRCFICLPTFILSVCHCMHLWMLRYLGLASLKQCHQGHDFLLEMKQAPVLLLNNLIILYCLSSVTWRIIVTATVFVITVSNLNFVQHGRRRPYVWYHFWKWYGNHGLLPYHFPLHIAFLLTFLAVSGRFHNSRLCSVQWIAWGVKILKDFKFWKKYVRAFSTTVFLVQMHILVRQK